MVFVFEANGKLTVLIDKIIAICAGLLVATALSANTDPIQFSVRQNPDRQFELDVVQKPLPEVLGVLAQNTGIIVHYSGLSAKPVKVNCQKATVKQIFDCLLADEANLVFRYGQSDVADGEKALVEVWVYGALVGDDKPKTLASNAAITVTQSLGDLTDNPLLKKLAAGEISQLLEKARAKDAELRTNAIAELALQPQAKNQEVRETLKNALSDPSAEVRAQAVFALGKYDDAEASNSLLSALQDTEVSVRLMVVDSADNQEYLLQQALNDSDESVRAYAATKLDALATQ